MMAKQLRSGYTTGACATAAARGAALMLRDQRRIDEVEITLPRGESARFTLRGQRFSPKEASCFVVKDAGDDPDITNGAEIHATVSLLPPASPSPQPSPTGGEGEHHIIITGGTGIGRVTKPGLAVPPGEWAINPVPRRMITEAIQSVFSSPESRVPDLTGPRSPVPLHCLLSIPDGELLAQKTLNARLGIVGGLSILGTTGIVRPISAQAWTDTIDAAIDVALACGCGTAVLSTGRTSELVAQQFLSNTFPHNVPSPLVGEGQGEGMPEITLPLPLSHEGRGNAQKSGLELNEIPGLPEEAFVMMGDHVGHALRSCVRKGVKRVVLAGQFAKLLKIACGHEQTHVSSSELDLRELRTWLAATPHTSHLTPHLHHAVTARGVLEASGNDRNLIELVCERARLFAESLAPGPEVKVLLAGYGGEVLYFA